MAAPVSLTPLAPDGAYAVRAPRHTDAVGGALRAAYSVGKLPPEISAALSKLDRTQ